MNNVEHIASKLWLERMDEPIPQGEIQDNYGVLYFCRQNPSPKRNDKSSFVWHKDQRADSHTEPEDVQLRYWSYEKNEGLRRYARDFLCNEPRHRRKIEKRALKNTERFQWM